jgi:WhiB family redox-sensing transcriptional regulator
MGLADPRRLPRHGRRIFYHPARERCRQKSERITRAKAVCQACPVITECATWALQTQEPYGVWGGMSEDERAAILGIPNPRYPRTRRTRTAPAPAATPTAAASSPSEC